MSNIDTTSFARILLGAMGQGADIYNRASSGAQSIVDSQQNRAFRDRAFAADQEQRAFGNNLATQDQAIQQAAADRAAQAFPLSQKMAESQLASSQFQFAQQQQKAEEDAMIGSILAPRVANKILELSAAKYGAPRFDDQMRAYAVTNGKVSADGMSYLLRNLNDASDLDKLQTVAKKNRSMIESTLRSSGVTPEMKAQGEGLLAMLESENPNTLREALRSAGQFQQQQAAQNERVGLVGTMQAGGPLSPEQQLAIQGDPALRRIFDQTNAPTITPEQQAAQDEAAAQDLIALGVPPDKALPYIRSRRAQTITASDVPMGGGVDQTVFLRKQVEDRKAEYDFAMERARAAGLIRKVREGEPATMVPVSSVPDDPSDPRRQAYASLIQAERGLERAMANLRNVGQQQPSPQQQGPVLLSELDAQRASQVQPQTANTYNEVKAQLTASLGRPPSPDEMRAAMRQRLLQQPAMPR